MIAAQARPRARSGTARCGRLGLTGTEWRELARLATPLKVQAFVNALPANQEERGETVHSVRNVLHHRCAHCIEAALLAACALWIHDEPPLLLHLDCSPSDYPHVVALFRRGRHWGAISKSNHAGLRYRDPVYRSLRELAMSYFHEYVDHRGRKTLRSVSAAFDLRRIDPAEWITREASCWTLHDRLAAARHYPLASPAQVRALAPRDAFERRVDALVEFPRTPHR
jgi:hypothetical protein